MSETVDLHAAYDGPLPRQQGNTTGHAGWMLLLRAHLRMIRTQRRLGAWEGLPELTARVGEIRKNLAHGEKK